MWRALFSLLSPGADRARLSILIFHRVHAISDPLFPGEPDAAFFETQVLWLKEWFNILPLHEAVARLISGSLPPRSLAITFDDGYADNFLVALPILRRHGVAATVFVATGFLEGGCMWNDVVMETLRRCPKTELDLAWLGLGEVSLASIADRRRAIEASIAKLKYLSSQIRIDHANRLAEQTGVTAPTDLMLTIRQLKELRGAGLNVGAHTVNHPILARLSPDLAWAEIAQAKSDLEDILSEEVELFAYPNGKPIMDYSLAHVEMARKAGFKAAVSTSWGAYGRDGDLFQLPRFTPWDRSSNKYGVRLAWNLTSVRPETV